MSPLEYPDWMQHLLAVFEAFRRLEFHPDDIYFRFNTDPRTGVTSLVATIEKPRGKLVFMYEVIRIFDTGKNINELQSDFIEACKAWNEPKNRAACMELWRQQTLSNLDFHSLCLKMHHMKLVNINEVIERAKQA